MHIGLELPLSENSGVLSPWWQAMHALCSKISTWRAYLLESSTAAKIPLQDSNLGLYRWWRAKQLCAPAMQGAAVGALDREGGILGTCSLCDLHW